MLQPKKVKHRKMFKGRLRGKAMRGNTLAFGTFGLQAMSSGFITLMWILPSPRCPNRHISKSGYWASKTAPRSETKPVRAEIGSAM